MVGYRLYRAGSGCSGLQRCGIDRQKQTAVSFAYVTSAGDVAPVSEDSRSSRSCSHHPFSFIRYIRRLLDPLTQLVVHHSRVGSDDRKVQCFPVDVATALPPARPELLRPRRPKAGVSRAIRVEYAFGLVCLRSPGSHLSLDILDCGHERPICRRDSLGRQG
jgi:hypothetical protein